MNTMDTVRRFFDKAPRFMHLGKALAEFERNDFRQPLEARNFLAFVEREAGDLDEESMLEYCRMHLEFAGLWNLGLELEVRACWRMASMLDYWQDLAADLPQAALADALAAGQPGRRPLPARVVPGLRAGHAGRLARRRASIAGRRYYRGHADPTNPPRCDGPSAVPCAGRT